MLKESNGKKSLIREIMVEITDILKHAAWEKWVICLYLGVMIITWGRALTEGMSKNV